jgi:cytochrome c oxidase subunit 3
MNRDQGLLAGDLHDVFKHTVLVRHELEERYRDLDQQTQTTVLGMWLFLATEVMFFGALFLALGVYRHLYPEAVEAASRQLNWQIASINTVVLLVSSFTMALAVHFAEHGKRRLLVLNLLVTALLGVSFLALKGYEYYTDFAEHLVPGYDFHDVDWMERGLSRDQVGHVQIFLWLYWIMTALHAVHMLVGISAVLILTCCAWRGVFSTKYHAPVEVLGLYWHFVDIVWIFLLPMLYLLGTHHL